MVQLKKFKKIHIVDKKDKKALFFLIKALILKFRKTQHLIFLSLITDFLYTFEEICLKNK